MPKVAEAATNFSGVMSALILPTCLESLVDVQFSYPMWLDDFRKLETMLYEFPNRVPSFLEGMKRKQKLFDGDRSDPVIALLDSIEFSYPQWLDDKLEAELAYIKTPPLAKKKIEAMKRKQELHSCDRTSPELTELDSLHLTYEGHEMDKTEAERLYMDYPTLFKVKIETMKRKQLLSGSTTAAAVVFHRASTGNILQIPEIDTPRQDHASETVSSSTLANVQADRLEEDVQRQIDVLHGSLFNYTGVDNDKKEAENLLLRYPLLFEKKLESMHRKQRLFNGDRSHPQVIALDSMTFSYPGWEHDVKTALRCHCEFPSIFDEKLQGMNNKEQAYKMQVIREQLEHQADKTSILKNRGTCIICLERSSTYAFVPCGHLCICDHCTSFENVCDKCPICRNHSQQVMKVFVS
jgi:hypothetical protein